MQIKTKLKSPYGCALRCGLKLHHMQQEILTETLPHGTLKQHTWGSKTMSVLLEWVQVYPQASKHSQSP